jgi:uncharacterized membrane protein YozB (DUF420 family)
MSASSVAGERPVPAGGFLDDHPWDRNFFLAWALLIWAGVLGGFVPEVLQHYATHAPAYPPIINIHGATFGGWLVLLTAQVLLIRSGRVQLHQRLGVAGAVLGAAMLVIGPATAVTMDRLEFGTANDNTPFLFVQMTDMASFAVLAGAGLLLRAHPSAHKRLMLLATLYISDAGFSRLLGDGLAQALGQGYWPYFAGLYLGNDVLILGLGGYDLITRRRLHPAYVAAVGWIAAIQMLSVHMRWDPAWKVTATHLLGH